MLPVLAYGEWQVETVEVDLGTGLREWIEIRRGGQHSYVATDEELDVILREHSIEPACLVPIQPEDGYE